MSAYEAVVIEADGGSRGNPGPAAFGALLRDAATGDVIVQTAEFLGKATNNVAEYRGLIAGLELYQAHADGAFLEVRMDSKLVIEQMAGRWKVKHPDMKPLALEANRLVPFGVEWTWVPREQNKAADRLANLAMDAAAAGETFDATADLGEQLAGGSSSQGPEPEPMAGNVPEAPPNLVVGWTERSKETQVFLLRHGVTQHTVANLFSGPGGDEDPGLTDEGWAQAHRAADWLAAEGRFDAIIASPLQRTQDTASAAAEALGLDVVTVDGFRECSFGEWDGLGIAQVRERFPDALEAWQASMAVAPPGGESVLQVAERVDAALDDLLETYTGRRVLVVSHVTPIKLTVRRAMQAPLSVLSHLQMAPASISRCAFYTSGVSTLRQFALVP